MKEIIALIQILCFNVTNAQSGALMHQSFITTTPPTGKGGGSPVKVRGNYFFCSLSSTGKMTGF